MKGVRSSFSVREVRPKDFYTISSWQNDGDSETVLRFKVFLLLSLNPWSFRNFLRLPSRKALKLIKWMDEEILKESLMEPRYWMELAFALSKERWGSDLDWLENQPMSKVSTMLDVSQKNYERQKAAMNKK